MKRGIDQLKKIEFGEEVENTGELLFFIVDILLKLVIVKFYIEYPSTTYYIMICPDQCKKDQ